MLEVGVKRSVCDTLLTLFKLAYRSRLSLPILVSAGFMLFDLHMRLEIEMEAHILQENNNVRPEEQ